MARNYASPFHLSSVNLLFPSLAVHSNIVKRTQKAENDLLEKAEIIKLAASKFGILFFFNKLSETG